MEALQALSRNERRENILLGTVKPSDYDTPKDRRPGWIPPEILYDWDTNPYAYQTEEELMPAGGLHGQILSYIAEILRDFLEKRGLRFLADTFMLYYDRQGIKQRIAPDLMIIPFCHPPPSAYDLETELAPPLAVVEITSPKSRAGDMRKKVSFYAGLEIPAYLVIDSITSGGDLREQIELHLWRRTHNRFRKIEYDAQGYLPVPEMTVKIKAKAQNLLFADIITGEILYDLGQMRQRAEQMRQRAEHEAMLRNQAIERAVQATKLAEQANKLAGQEKQRAERLAAKLRKLGVSPDE